MSKDLIPLYAEDISAFAKALGRQLSAAEAPPKHLALMNMLARAGGFQNYQHLRKASAGQARPEAVPEPLDLKLVARAERLFDAAGQLSFWHGKRSVQDLCTWVLWAQLPKGEHMNERQISTRLDAMHSFGDAAVLRRRMVTLGLAARARDGSDYLRLEQAPPAEARALIARISARPRGS